MKYKFEIQERLPSYNEYAKANRTNKYVGAEMKKNTEFAIWTYIVSQLKNIKIHNPVFITFTWVEENKKRDLDNVCFAKKFILDCMVKCGKLKDDNRNCVTGFTDTFEYGTETKVILDIEEV